MLSRTLSNKRMAKSCDVLGLLATVSLSTLMLTCAPARAEQPGDGAHRPIRIVSSAGAPATPVPAPTRKPALTRASDLDPQVSAPPSADHRLDEAASHSNVAVSDAGSLLAPPEASRQRSMMAASLEVAAVLREAVESSRSASADAVDQVMPSGDGPEPRSGGDPRSTTSKDGSTERARSAAAEARPALGKVGDRSTDPDKVDAAAHEPRGDQSAANTPDLATASLLSATPMASAPSLTRASPGEIVQWVPRPHPARSPARGRAAGAIAETAARGDGTAEALVVSDPASVSVAPADRPAVGAPAQTTGPADDPAARVELASSETTLSEARSTASPSIPRPHPKRTVTRAALEAASQPDDAAAIASDGPAIPRLNPRSASAQDRNQAERSSRTLPGPESDAGALPQDHRASGEVASPPSDEPASDMKDESGPPLAAMEPEATSKAVEPEATSKAVEPEVTSKAAEPEATSKAAEPEATSKAAEPEAASKAAEPEAASKAVEPEATSKAAEPEATSKAAEPEATSKAAEPEATSKAAEPEAASKAAEQEAASKAAEPEATSTASDTAADTETVPEAAAEAAARWDGTEPHRLVRMMNALQDDIARGSGAALAAQRVLGARVAQDYLSAPGTVWSDPKNAAALLSYALSGGEPQVVDAVVRANTFEPPYDVLLDGALAFAQGRSNDAKRHFADVNLTRLPRSVRGPVYLALAALSVDEDPHVAQEHLAHARYSAPGTLVEEAALRRSVLLAAEADDVDDFHQLTSRYLRKFRTSVYAGNFRRRLAAAITRMQFVEEDGAFERLDEILEPMSAAGKQELFLLVARSAVEHGSRVAARRAAERTLLTAAPGTLDRLRAELYKASAEVVDPDRYGEAIDVLEALDVAKLPADDRALRTAALRLVQTVAALPEAEMAALHLPEDAHPVGSIEGGEAVEGSDPAESPSREGDPDGPDGADPAASGDAGDAVDGVGDGQEAGDGEATTGAATDPRTGEPAVGQEGTGADRESEFAGSSALEERVAQALSAVDELLEDAR